MSSGQKNSKRQSWITVPNSKTSQDYLFTDQGVQAKVPVEISVSGQALFPHKLKSPSHLTVIGEIRHVGSRFYVAQLPSGSGVANPIICLYEIGDPVSSLRFVWPSTLFSVYGFNSCELKEGKLALLASYPGGGGKKEHTSSEFLPVPDSFE